MKTCKTCKENYPATLEYFGKRANIKDGLNNICKKCQKEINEIYYENHKDIMIEQAKQRQEKRGNEALEYRRNHYKNNKKATLETNKEYYYKNIEYVSDLRKKYRQSENGKQKYKIYGRKRRSKNHKLSVEQWEACKEYFNNACAYCGFTEEEHKNNFKQQLHKEHVIDDGRNDIKNCIPSCRVCNSEKHTTSLNNWYNIDNRKYNYERYYKIYLWIRYDCKKAKSI